MTLGFSCCALLSFFLTLWHFQQGDIIILIHNYRSQNFCSFSARNSLISTDYKKKIPNYLNIWYLNVTWAEGLILWWLVLKEKEVPFTPGTRGTTEEIPHLLYLFSGLLQRAFSISPLELSLFSTPLLEKKVQQPSLHWTLLTPRI